MEIELKVEGLSFKGELFETPTGRIIAAALPLEGLANRWGGEYYLTVPLEAGLEPGAGEVVEPGDLAFWPPGPALCLFWGPTPASQGRECRAASPVNRVGRVFGDLEPLNNLGGRASIRLDKIQA